MGLRANNRLRVHPKDNPCVVARQLQILVLDVCVDLESRMSPS